MYEAYLTSGQQVQPFHVIDVYAIVENVPQREQIALTVEDG